jgi:hypothetical protein
MYLIKRQPKPPGSDGWIMVTVNSFPMGYDLDALTANFPTPGNGIDRKSKVLEP